MNKVTMIMGPPASGKTTCTQAICQPVNTIRLNRDIEGGLTLDLLPKMVQALRQGKDVVMDNLFVTAAKRRPFIKAAHAEGATVSGILMETSIEDSQINALTRMWGKLGHLCFTPADIKTFGNNDPGIFPIQVFFRYRREAETPNTAEGFDEVSSYKFKRVPRSEYGNKAVIFDFDGTLRASTGGYMYPTKPDEVKTFMHCIPKLKDLQAQGYLLLGASNQSGIAKGILSDDDAVACFERTLADLRIPIDYMYCPHHVPPINCYCRKPQSGFAVYFIEKYKLDPTQTIMVGDQTTDKTFAKRAGFQFESASKFFNGNKICQLQIKKRKSCGSWNYLGWQQSQVK